MDFNFNLKFGRQATTNGLVEGNCYKKPWVQGWRNLVSSGDHSYHFHGSKKPTYPTSTVLLHLQAFEHSTHGRWWCSYPSQVGREWVRHENSETSRHALGPHRDSSKIWHLNWSSLKVPIDFDKIFWFWWCDVQNPHEMLSRTIWVLKMCKYHFMGLPHLICSNNLPLIGI